MRTVQHDLHEVSSKDEGEKTFQNKGHVAMNEGLKC